MNHLSVTVEKILPATFQEVFDARLNPGGLREWMRPGPGGEIVNTSTYPILERLVVIWFTPGESA